MNFTSIAILSAFFAAIANILARVLSKQIPSKKILAINFLIMAGTLLILSPFFYKFTITLQSIELLFIISIVDAIGNYFYFKTFEKTEASIATPLLSLAPIFSFIFSWIFLRDVVNTKTYILAGSITILILFFSVDFKHIKKFKFHTLIPAITSSLLFGISAIPTKFLLNSTMINAPTLYMFRSGFIGLLALAYFGNTFQETTKSQYKIIFIRGLFVITQWVLLYYALTKGNTGVSLTLGNITPIFVFIFASLFLGEKPTVKKVITSLLILGLSFTI